MAQEIEQESNPAIAPVPGGVQHLVPEGFYTRDTVAKRIGRSRDTIGRWMREGKFTPRYQMKVGKLTIYLYDEDDIKTLKGLTETTRRGRPPRTKENS